MTGRIVDSFPQTRNLPTRAIRLGLKSRIYSGGTPDKSNLDFWEGGELPWIGSGEVNQRHITVPTAYISEEAVRNSATKLFPMGSVAMALAGQGKTKATVVTMGIDAYGNQSLACISDYAGDNRFLFWWLSSLYREIRGLSSQDTRDGLNQSMIGQIPVPDYDAETQKAIADFLDRETGRIDQLIEKKKFLIEVLDAKKQSLLESSVLGGASVNRADPSNWLIDLPDSWVMVPLKHLTSTIGGATPSKDREDFWTGSIPWVSPKDMKQDEISDVPDHVSEAAVAGSALSMVPKGAVLIVVRGMILARHVPVCLLTVDGTINQDMKALIPEKSKISGRYLQCMLQGFNILLKSFIEESAHGTKKLRSEQLFTMKFPVPPIHQQEKIVQQISRAKKQSLNLIEKTNTSIDRLREFRAALITAAVTGQIDVAAWGKRGQTDRRLDQIEAEMSVREARA